MKYSQRTRKTKEQKKQTSKHPKKKFIEHPLYGRIPLIVERRQGRGDLPYQTMQCDPQYKPSLPRGALRGDITKQAFCGMCHIPKYFYIDEKKICVQCEQTFVFRASEQKYWHESLKFHFDSEAIRCPHCRKKRRTEKALRTQITEARSGLKTDSDNPGLLLSLSESLIRYHQRSGEGNLDEAIAAARRAIKLWPSAYDALFWEGLAHYQAGRQNKSRILLQQFLEKGSQRTYKFQRLIGEAHEYLDKL